MSKSRIILILAFVFFFLYPIPVSAAVCPPSIGFGETNQCSIDSADEADTYTFSASAGDKVLVRMSKSSGTLWPGIRVYGPSGTQLCEASGSTSAEIASCALTSSGTYSILAYDGFNGTYIGNYYLYLQRLNNPGSPVPITFGQTLSGSITTPAEMDTYTFTASAGDEVLVRMSKSSGTFWPGIRVYGPTGTQLCEASGSASAEIASCALTSSGTYSILAYDGFNGTYIGDYSLYLQQDNPANPVPSLTSLSPSSATAGGAAFTLTVNGTNFINGSVVRWNGTARTTTYVSATQLTASILAADIATTGTYPVTVFNPTPGGGTSNAVSFTVTASNPVPSLTTLSPSSATAGGAAFTLTVNGTSFINGSVVRWNGSARTTTYVSATQLTASILAADIATAGSYPVTVFNPTPGGGTSNAVNFTVTTSNPVPIAFGQTLSGSITTPAEMDTYTFAASAGDKVLVRMSKSSGTFYPKIRVFSPNGTQLCEAFSSSTAEIASCTLTSTGTYTILAFDGYTGTYTGDYYLYLQRLNNPGSPVPIIFGQTLSGSVMTPAEMDTYTFAASAGDMVVVRMSKSSGTFYPGIRVNGPNGTQLCEAAFSSSTAEIASCALASTGTYTILTFDGYTGTYTGNYYLYLQRLNNPGSPVSIAFGQTLSGSVMTPAEMDTYTFAASAGDKVLVRMSKSAGTFYPGIRVNGPNGTQLCEAAFSSSTAEIASCTLTSTGTHTILTFDGYTGTYTGNYYLYLQRLNNPGSPVSIAFGQTLSGSVMTPAEMDTYTFSASSGDMVVVRMSKSSGTFYPGIRVYGPDGAKLCEASDSSTARIASCTLTSAGTYTILAFDYFGTYTGDYSLYLQQNNPGNPTPITFGVPQEIDVSSDLPTWFEIEVLSNTANLFLTLQKYSSWSGELKLYSGTQLLASTADYADQILRWPSPTPGTYLVEVSGSGSGRLTAYIALPELPLGQWVVGSIYGSWGSAWYQFTVPPGQSSIYLHVETIGDFSQLQVYRGALDGTMVGSASGPSMNIDISSPQPGVYYVHLTDSAWIEGGSQTRDHMIRADANPIEPPPCTTPVITNFTPTKGGTAGPVTVTVNGACLDLQASVCLTKTGQTNQCASTVTGQNDQRSLTAQFDLASAVSGDWTLSVTNPNAQSASGSTPFTIQTQGEAKLWVDIVGRSTIRTGRVQTFIIRYGNTGNVDAVAIPLLIGGIPSDATWELGFELKEPAQPVPSQPVDWAQTAIHIEDNGYVIIPLMLPVIPPGYEGELPIKITIPTNRTIQLRAWMNPIGLLGQNGRLSQQSATGSTCSQDSEQEACITGLVKDVLKLIPGVNCLVDIEAYYLKYFILGAKPAEIHSIAWDMIGIILSCAKDANIYLTVAKATYWILSKAIWAYHCFAAVNEGTFIFFSLMSFSPEDKYGPTGWDSPDTPAEQLKHWVMANKGLHYRIDFWNKEDAPAATTDVIITDTLDSDLDWSTFQFTEVGFLDWKEPLEPGQYFNVNIPNVTIDLSRYYPGQPTVTMTVNATGTFDPVSGMIRWEFHALDPVTLQPPENPYAGFLPPITNTGWEIGWVNFSASPKPDLASGTVISNQAFVKFDVDVFKPAPKLGPFVNTLDALPPVSAVQSPAGTQRCAAFVVSWSGVDDANGSGLGGFDVYVDDLGDASPAYLWQANTTTHSTLFTGVPGHSYGFYSRARDNVGNVEATPQPFGYDVEVTAGNQCGGYLPLVLTNKP